MGKALALALGVAVAAAAVWFLALRKDDEDLVRSTVDGFAAAVHREDFRAVCDRYLTSDLEQRLQLYGDCPGVLRRSTAARTFDPRFKLAVKSVDVRGDTAFARVETTARGRTATIRVRLHKQRGRWRLATLR
jgi:ketosteroid isomerase-like protein